MVFFPLLPLLINGYQDLYNSPMGFLIDGDALHHIAILQVSYMACFYLPLLPRTCRLHLADVPASYPPIRLLPRAERPYSVMFTRRQRHSPPAGSGAGGYARSYSVAARINGPKHLPSVASLIRVSLLLPK